MKQILKSFFLSRHWGWRLTRIAVLVPTLFICLLVLFQNRVIFVPTTYPGGYYKEAENEVIARHGITIQDVSFQSQDGILLHGWWSTPNQWSHDQDLALLWCHGNAGNISHRINRVLMLNRMGYAVFIFDYRGYGKSQGKPDEAGVYMDAMAAWDWLAAQQSLDTDQIVIYGVSLGGAIAIDLTAKLEADKKPPLGLLLESTFTSIIGMKNERMPFIPDFLVRARMDSLSKIPLITCPILMLHGTDDEIIPFHLGKALYGSASDPKLFVPIQGGMHNDLDTYDTLYWKPIGTYLEKLNLGLPPFDQATTP